MDLVKNNDATYTMNPIGIANQMDTLIKYNTMANIAPKITNFISDFNNEISDKLDTLSPKQRAGAVAILMMPRNNPTRRLAAQAANKVEDAAWKISDKLRFLPTIIFTVQRYPKKANFLPTAEKTSKNPKIKPNTKNTLKTSAWKNLKICGKPICIWSVRKSSASTPSFGRQY